MTILFTFILGFVSTLLGKFIFRKWFNHITIYTLIWTVMIMLYEIRLMPFADLNINTWIIIIVTYSLFLLGCFTIFAARSLGSKSNSIYEIENPILNLSSNNEQILKWLIIFISIVGLLNAIHHWSVLIKEFGSVLGVIINATKYYRMRVGGEIEGMLPYLYIVSYVGIFFSGIYTAYKSKITIVGILPILVVVIREVANLGRAGILFGLLEFLITFLLMRHYLSSHRTIKSKPSRRNLVIAMLVIITIAVSGAVIVKSVRNPIDNFKGTSASLKAFEGSSFIS